MRRKYRSDEVVTVSVNLDPADEVTNTRVVNFLEKQKASALVNVRLLEELDFWKEKFHNDGVLPTVFVFNRQGKYLRFPLPGKSDFTYDDIDQQVAKFLAEK